MKYVRKRQANHNWIESDKEIVRLMYDGTGRSLEVIAGLLGVTCYSVKGQVRAMGLCKRRADGWRWTPKKDKQLQELMEHYSTGVVAKIMHRSINSVVVRSKRIGVRRRSREWYSKKDVMDILGVDHKVVQWLIDSGRLRARPHNPLRKPKKNGMAMWHIEPHDLADYIIRFPDELNGRNVDMIQVVYLLVGRRSRPVYVPYRKAARLAIRKLKKESKGGDYGTAKHACPVGRPAGRATRAKAKERAIAR